MEREHIFLVVGLTQVLDDYVILPRTSPFLDKKAKATAPQPEADLGEDASMEDAPNFASFEKSLWYVPLEFGKACVGVFLTNLCLHCSDLILTGFLM